MFELRPQRSNKKAESLIILFFVGAAALVLLSVPLKGIPFLWAIQLFAVMLLVASVYLVTRYITKGFIYRIEDTEGGADLTVTEVASGGRRQITVCRVSLSGIREAVEDSDGKELKRLRGGQRKIYDYRPDLSPARSIVILSEECGVECVILLAYDERLLELVRR